MAITRAYVQRTLLHRAHGVPRQRTATPCFGCARARQRTLRACRCKRRSTASALRTKPYAPEPPAKHQERPASMLLAAHGLLAAHSHAATSTQLAPPRASSPPPPPPPNHVQNQVSDHTKMADEIKIMSFNVRCAARLAVPAQSRAPAGCRQLPHGAGGAHNSVFFASQALSRRSAAQSSSVLLGRSRRSGGRGGRCWREPRASAEPSLWRPRPNTPAAPRPCLPQLRVREPGAARRAPAHTSKRAPSAGQQPHSHDTPCPPIPPGLTTLTRRRMTSGPCARAQLSTSSTSAP